MTTFNVYNHLEFNFQLKGFEVDGIFTIPQDIDLKDIYGPNNQFVIVSTLKENLIQNGVLYICIKIP